MATTSLVSFRNRNKNRSRKYKTRNYSRSQYHGYYLKNREKLIAYSKRYKKKNRDKVNDYQRKYYNDHLEQKRNYHRQYILLRKREENENEKKKPNHNHYYYDKEYHRAYYRSHKNDGEYIARIRRYYRDNRGRILAYVRNYSKVKANADRRRQHQRQRYRRNRKKFNLYQLIWCWTLPC